MAGELPVAEAFGALLAHSLTSASDHLAAYEETVLSFSRDAMRWQDLSPSPTVEEIATARERRAQLAAEMRETERQLEEALRSLGERGDN